MTLCQDTGTSLRQDTATWRWPDWFTQVTNCQTVGLELSLYSCPMSTPLPFSLLLPFFSTSPSSDALSVTLSQLALLAEPERNLEKRWTLKLCVGWMAPEVRASQKRHRLAHCSTCCLIPGNCRALSSRPAARHSVISHTPHSQWTTCPADAGRKPQLLN